MAWQHGRSYSQDLRDRVLAADALTSRQAAARFAVSVSYVIKARQRDRTGALTTKTCGYRRAPGLSGLDEVIVAEVERRLSATLADLREWLARSCPGAWCRKVFLSSGGCLFSRPVLAC